MFDSCWYWMQYIFYIRANILKLDRFCHEYLMYQHQKIRKRHRCLGNNLMNIMNMMNPFVISRRLIYKNYR